MTVPTNPKHPFRECETLLLVAHFAQVEPGAAPCLASLLLEIEAAGAPATELEALSVELNMLDITDPPASLIDRAQSLCGLLPPGRAYAILDEHGVSFSGIKDACAPQDWIAALAELEKLVKTHGCADDVPFEKMISAWMKAYCLAPDDSKKIMWASAAAQGLVGPVSHVTSNGAPIFSVAAFAHNIGVELDDAYELVGRYGLPGDHQYQGEIHTIH